MKKNFTNMDFKNNIVLFSLGLIILVAGVFAGILFDKVTAGKKLGDLENSIKTINSNLIPYINAFGEIKSINGRELKLAYAGDEVKLFLTDDVKILTLITQLNGPNTSKDIQLSDLKVGNFISAVVSIRSDGAFEGSRILVVPVVSQ